MTLRVKGHTCYFGYHFFFLRGVQWLGARELGLEIKRSLSSSLTGGISLCPSARNLYLRGLVLSLFEYPQHVLIEYPQHVLID